MKKISPQIPLGLICRNGLGSVFKKIGLVDYFWEIEKGKSQSYTSALKCLDVFDIQLLVTPHTSIRTTVFCAKINAREKITFAKPWNLITFNQRLKWPKEYPEALRLLTLIKSKSIELQGLFKQLPNPQDFIKKNEKSQLLPSPPWADPVQAWKKQEQSESLLRAWDLQGKKWIALFPGSVWATKKWKKEGYIKVGQSLQKSGYKIVIMGGPDEKSLGQEVASSISDSLNLCGETSLFESLIFLSHASLVVGNDSSSSHMGTLVGVPVVSIFGPTVLSFGYRPWGKQTAVVELTDLNCRPCGSHGPMKCPLGHHNCMDKLDVTEVLRVIQGMIN